MSFTSLVYLKNKNVSFLKQALKNKNYTIEHYVTDNNENYYLVKTDSKLELNLGENEPVKVFRVHYRNGVYFTINAVNFMISKNLYVDTDNNGNGGVKNKRIKWHAIKSMFKGVLNDRILIVKVKYNNLQFLILKKV